MRAIPAARYGGNRQILGRERRLGRSMGMASEVAQDLSGKRNLTPNILWCRGCAKMLMALGVKPGSQFGKNIFLSSSGCDFAGIRL